MGSKRCPGKMMQLINGKPIIDWVIARSIRSELSKKIVLATTELTHDECLAVRARMFNCEVFNGSENDVLGRFFHAAKVYEPQIIVRVCGDRPLISYKLIDQAIKLYLEGGVDLVYNHISGDQQNWPRGFGVEVFSYELLAFMHRVAKKNEDREHVTSYMWNNRKKYKIIPTKCFGSYKNLSHDIKLDVDTQEDLKKIRLISRNQNINSEGEEFIKEYKRLYAN
jgi:spore coat polysaccharide biosynthesis protein SpsF